MVDHGRVIAEGDADRLKAQVGGERIEVTVTDPTQLARAEEVLAPLAVGALGVDQQRRGLVVPVSGGAARLADALRRLDAERIGLDDIGLPDPHSTTCSSRSPATRPSRPSRLPTSRRSHGDRPRLGARRAGGREAQPHQDQAGTRLAGVHDLSPIMFVLLFAYVFGGTIDRAGVGGAYREFLIAGIFAQTVVFGATITGAGLADDLSKGIVDRFRSLPMAPRRC